MNDDFYSRELHAWIEPELEARVVALILGEASDFEAEELERLMDERPEIRTFKRRLEAVHGLVGEALVPADEDEWKLPETMKANLWEAIGVAGGDEKATVLPVRGKRDGRDERIRKAGRRVAWSVAACFAVTLFLFVLASPMMQRPGFKAAEDSGPKRTDGRSSGEVRYLWPREAEEQLAAEGAERVHRGSYKAEESTRERELKSRNGRFDRITGMRDPGTEKFVGPGQGLVRDKLAELERMLGAVGEDEAQGKPLASGRDATLVDDGQGGSARNLRANDYREVDARKEDVENSEESEPLDLGYAGGAAVSGDGGYETRNEGREKGRKRLATQTSTQVVPEDESGELANVRGVLVDLLKRAQPEEKRPGVEQAAPTLESRSREPLAAKPRSIAPEEAPAVADPFATGGIAHGLTKEREKNKSVFVDGYVPGGAVREGQIADSESGREEAPVLGDIPATGSLYRTAVPSQPKPAPAPAAVPVPEMVESPREEESVTDLRIVGRVAEGDDDKPDDAKPAARASAVAGKKAGLKSETKGNAIAGGGPDKPGEWFENDGDGLSVIPMKETAKQGERDKDLEDAQELHIEGGLNAHATGESGGWKAQTEAALAREVSRDENDRWGGVSNGKIAGTTGGRGEESKKSIDGALAVPLVDSAPTAEDEAVVRKRVPARRGDVNGNAAGAGYGLESFNTKEDLGEVAARRDEKEGEGRASGGGGGLGPADEKASEFGVAHVDHGKDGKLGFELEQSEGEIFRRSVVRGRDRGGEASPGFVDGFGDVPDIETASLSSLNGDQGDSVRANPKPQFERPADGNKEQWRLQTGKGLTDLGRLEEAQTRYQETLRSDPGNAEARKGLERLNKLQSKYYQSAHDETRAKLLEEVDTTWEAVVPPVDSKTEGVVLGGLTEEDYYKLGTGFNQLTEVPRKVEFVKGPDGTLQPVVPTTPGTPSGFSTSTEFKDVAFDDVLKSLDRMVPDHRWADVDPLDKDDFSKLPPAKKMLLSDDYRRAREEYEGAQDKLEHLRKALDQVKTDELERSVREAEDALSERRKTLSTIVSAVEIPYFEDTGGPEAGGGILANEVSKLERQGKEHYLYYDNGSGAVSGIVPEAEEQFVARSWEVPAEVWKKIASGYAVLPVELRERAREGQVSDGAPAYLSGLGIDFRDGAGIDYLPEQGRIVAMNTEENNELFDKIVEATTKEVEKESAARESFEKRASAEPFSVFSLHVSDVSFKLAKAALEQGQWPEPDKVRVEEFVNAFDYGDPAPTQKEQVACQIEQAAHPFMQQRNLVRISMKTAALGRSAGTPLRLTVLLDNSGSMERADRADSVRSAFRLLAAQLHPQDQVTLISFARTPRLVADRMSGDQAGELANLVDSTPSEGGTNIEEALRLGIAKANEQMLEGSQNRIILLTDGAANLGNAKPEELAKLVGQMRQQGIAFDACGVGAEGLNDEILESLTRKGDGRYYFLDRPEDADAGFAKQIAGALRPAAKNVKVQVIFNPNRVGRYKLYGFEKHRLEKEDFRNDSVDAAELAAEEAGNAIYQVEVLPEGEGDIGTVSVRFQDTATGEMVERKWAIPYEADAPRLAESSASLRLASGAALLGETLKESAIGELVDLEELTKLMNGLRSDYASDERVRELIEMTTRTRALSNAR